MFGYIDVNLPKERSPEAWCILLETPCVYVCVCVCVCVFVYV